MRERGVVSFHRTPSRLLFGVPTIERGLDHGGERRRGGERHRGGSASERERGREGGAMGGGEREASCVRKEIG